MVYIYVLKHPTTNEIKYVGKTINLKRRYYSHIQDSKRLVNNKRYLLNWIRSLLKENLKPVMEVIEICEISNWQEREIYWINHYRMTNSKLCNICDGGENNLIGRQIKNMSIERKDEWLKNLRESHSKFTTNEIEKIWELILGGKRLREIQLKYPKVTRSQLCEIRAGRTWKNITKLKENPIKRGVINTKQNTGKGYFFNNTTKKWISKVVINKKEIILGRFNTEDDAKNCIIKYRNKVREAVMIDGGA